MLLILTILALLLLLFVVLKTNSQKKISSARSNLLAKIHETNLECKNLYKKLEQTRTTLKEKELGDSSLKFSSTDGVDAFLNRIFEYSDLLTDDIQISQKFIEKIDMFVNLVKKADEILKINNTNDTDILQSISDLNCYIELRESYSNNIIKARVNLIEYYDKCINIIQKNIVGIEIDQHINNKIEEMIDIIDRNLFFGTTEMPELIKLCKQVDDEIYNKQVITELQIAQAKLEMYKINVKIQQGITIENGATEIDLIVDHILEYLDKASRTLNEYEAINSLAQTLAKTVDRSLNLSYGDGNNLASSLLDQIYLINETNRYAESFIQNTKSCIISVKEPMLETKALIKSKTKN